jgi:KDO2-lipid IV(A) lauroyltransferase
MIVIYWFWRLGSWCAGHAPLRVSRALARMVGRLGFWLLPSMRSHASANYAQVIGLPPTDPEVRRVTKLAFSNFALYLLDVMRFPYISDAELGRRVVLHDQDVFRRALDEHKGVIFVSAHFGNMELAGVQLARQFAPMTLAAEVLKARKVYEWLVANRARHNVRLVPYKKAARSIITALHDNEFVGFFLDLGIAYDHRGVPVRFFGKTAYFPAAPALLAHHTGSPIIQCFAVIGDDGLIHGHTFPTIHQDKSMSRDVFVQSVTQQFAANMEEFIGRHPEQWYIFRRIWPDDSQSEETHEAYPLPARAG